MKALILLPAAFLLMNRYAFSQDGSLDSTFGVNGKVTTYLDYAWFGSAIYAMAVQPDGKIVAAGIADVSGPLTTAYGCVRYNLNGSPDSTFGENGQVIGFYGTNFQDADAILLQPDGKIVLKGLTVYGFGMDRLNMDGSANNSFNTILTEDFRANSIALEPDGKIIGGGSVEGTTGGFSLIRYNIVGIIDSSFGINGIGSTLLNSYSSISSIALQPDGKIVATGSLGSPDYGFALVRFLANGSLDSSFGTNGLVISGIGSYFYSNLVSLQPDGKIITVGQSDIGSLLSRYNSNGTIDSSFGINGLVISSVGVSARAFALQPDGKIVIAGSGSDDFGLVRYNSSGSLDSTFGTGGKVLTDFDDSADEAFSVVIDLNGKIVVGGSSDNKFGIARYNSGLNVGIPQITEVDNSISIYPNPFGGIFQITNSSLPIQAAEVFNVFGESVFSTSNVNSQISNFIDLSNQPDGVYFLHLNANNAGIVKKVVISH